MTARFKSGLRIVFCDGKQAVKAAIPAAAAELAKGVVNAIREAAED